MLVAQVDACPLGSVLLARLERWFDSLQCCSAGAGLRCLTHWGVLELHHVATTVYVLSPVDSILFACRDCNAVSADEVEL